MESDNLPKSRARSGSVTSDMSITLDSVRLTVLPHSPSGSDVSMMSSTREYLDDTPADDEHTRHLKRLGKQKADAVVDEEEEHPIQDPAI